MNFYIHTFCHILLQLSIFIHICICISFVMISLLCVLSIYIAAQDLPDKNADQPVVHPGLHPPRQLRGDGPHPLCHPHHSQPQALSGYQGEVKFNGISFCICICICIYCAFVFHIPLATHKLFLTFNVNNEWAEIPFIQYFSLSQFFFFFKLFINLFAYIF